jgi:hypothetical protein
MQGRVEGDRVERQGEEEGKREGRKERGWKGIWWKRRKERVEGEGDKTSGGQ